MTSAGDAELILTSLEHAGERGGDLTGGVYARLFAARPELEPLFVMDTNGAVRGEMLARAIEAIIDFVGVRAYANHLIGAEATNHESYSVPREAFSAFFHFIRDEVQEACGDAWTDATEAAWNALLAQLDGYIGAPA